MIPRALNAPLSWIGLMRVSEHEAKFNRAVADLATQADQITLLEQEGLEAGEIIVAQTRAVKLLETKIAELDVTPWKHSCGDPPDYESPLGCVYDSGIGYAYARLADWLGVTDYEMGDGSEDYATDVGRTGANVLVAAGFATDDGDLLTASDIAALKADALLWRTARLKRRGNK